MASFEEGVAQLFIRLEELKRSLRPTSDRSDESEVWRNDLDTCVQQLDSLLRMHLDDPADDVKGDMYRHCRQRVKDVAKYLVEFVTSPQEDNCVIDFNYMEGHAAVARITELSLIVAVHMSGEEGITSEDSAFVSDMVDSYSCYQKAVLRQRAKPAIAHLAAWRNQSRTSTAAIVEDDAEGYISHPHSHCVTVILGQASALIHPLLMWLGVVQVGSVQEQLCRSSVYILDEQAQTLTKTVSDWFWEDRKVDSWMQKVAEPPEQCNLSELDGLVEEMAFCCQLFARYHSLLINHEGYMQTISQELMPEWNWKYASLERFLGTQQWNSAMKLATPVNILVGSSVKVPSVVEDAQYLSMRALDRATSTRSSLAMGTVAHSLSHDIWSTDIEGGINQALNDKLGCWVASEENPKNQEKNHSPKSSFASALLDALDDDLGPSSRSRPQSRPTSAPTSGGFLVSLGMGGQQNRQTQLETQFCSLNGIFSASASSKVLAQSLETWLAEDDGANETSMIQLAKEELERYKNAYESMLADRIRRTVLEYCGHHEDMMTRKDLCIHALRDYFVSENFGLRVNEFEKAESDSRLERILLTPLKESILVSQLDKCDSHVGILICRELSKTLAEMILFALWEHQDTVTDWGALLLSKETRVLQTYVQTLIDVEDGEAPPSFLGEWEKVSQAVTILQLERPSDWSIYAGSSLLSTAEIKQTMSLRKDFSPDAIDAVCQQIEAASKNT